MKKGKELELGALRTRATNASCQFLNPIIIVSNLLFFQIELYNILFDWLNDDATPKYQKFPTNKGIFQFNHAELIFNFSRFSVDAYINFPVLASMKQQLPKNKYFGFIQPKPTLSKWMWRHFQVEPWDRMHFFSKLSAYGLRACSQYFRQLILCTLHSWILSSHLPLSCTVIGLN